jgi:hypothetical protein
VFFTNDRFSFIDVHLNPGILDPLDPCSLMFSFALFEMIPSLQLLDDDLLIRIDTDPRSNGHGLLHGIMN